MFASLLLISDALSISVVLAVLFAVAWYILKALRDHKTVHLHSDSSDEAYPEPKSVEQPTEVHCDPTSALRTQELDRYRGLFYKLHNLERFPDVLPEARQTLLNLFAESLSCAQNNDEPSILSLKEYSEEALGDFVNGVHHQIGERWDDYVQRRKAGAPREMFKERADALKWLKTQAPIKLVDGAWLGHIHRFSAPFATRKITKNTWQVMSEELGDGDLAKNHAYLYQALLREVGLNMPSADSKAFVDPSLGIDDLGVWRASLAQLLISLFPHDFLPEILGFNLHFEILTWDTLCATRELQECGIDNYYFLLHISIDNAHSGHTAMATKVVVDYLKYVHDTESPGAAQQAWKRVQAGYLLSECIADTSSSSSIPSEPLNVWNSYAGETLRLFQAKSAVSQKLHCTSRTRIGGRLLVEWLDPKNMKSMEWAQEFLEALSRASYWVVPGDSSKSRVVKALSWGGKMFGAFSDSEVRTIRLWINHLLAHGTVPQKVYWNFTERHGRDDVFSEPSDPQDILTRYPVLVTSNEQQLSSMIRRQPTSHSPLSASLVLGETFDLARLTSLWFAQVSLLEGMITVPIKTCNVSASALVRAVRAQRGFLPVLDGCAGMDEATRTSCVGLHELGRELTAQLQCSNPENLKNVFDECGDTSMAENLMHLSMRPMEYGAALQGMAWAFACLHNSLGTDAFTLFSSVGRDILATMAEVEMRELRLCYEQLKSVGERRLWSQGFALAKRELESVFT